jgi:hypothetical protein
MVLVARGGFLAAPAIGPAKRLWSVHNYVCYPVHVSHLQRALWAEQRKILLTTGLNGQKHRKTLPTS